MKLVNSHFHILELIHIGFIIQQTLITIPTMSYESGSLECRKLIEAKESLIKIMQSLEYLDEAEEMTLKLKEIYKEIEEMHEKRRTIELGGII